MGADKPSLKSRQDISLMRKAGRIVAETLALIAEQTRPGVSTAELDRLAYEHIRARAPRPRSRATTASRPRSAPRSTTRSSTASRGRASCEEGDLFSADCGAFYRGFHADAAITIGVGHIDPALQQMIDHGWEALAEGIKRAPPGNRVDDISAAIQQSLLEPRLWRRGRRPGRPWRWPAPAREPHGEQLWRLGPRPAPAARHDPRHRADVHPAQRAVEYARRRLDGRHARSEPGRPCRTHRRHHRGRARSADTALEGNRDRGARTSDAQVAPGDYRDARGGPHRRPDAGAVGGAGAPRHHHRAA